MKPKSNYTRVMAGFYIFLCLIASLILGEIIYFVAIVPLISNHIPAVIPNGGKNWKTNNNAYADYSKP